MRKPVFIIFIIIYLLTLSCSPKIYNKKSSVKISSNRPNIVLIVADDMGIGDVSGLNPDSKINTPNIDKLIKNGIAFTDAHSTASICTPSRYSIMTGRYAWRTKLKQGVLNGYSKAMIKAEIVTLPEMLKKHGYSTALTGKWHLGWNWKLKDDMKTEMEENRPYNYKASIENNIDYTKPFSGGPVDNGFDCFYGISASLDFPPYVFSRNNMVTQNPDMFFAGTKAVRDKYMKKQKMQRKGPMSSDFDTGKVLQHLTDKSIDFIRKSSSDTPFFLYFSMTAPHTPVVPAKEFTGKSQAGIYGDYIEELDARVGQIMHVLNEKGIEDNTIIIFTADNGASKSSFPIPLEKIYGHKPSRELKGRKGSLHEGGHRVPFIIQWKDRINGGIKENTMISQADLYSTFASLLYDNQKDQGVDSYSLLPLILGQKDEYKRKYLVVTNYGGRFSIRKSLWKLDLNPDRKKRKLHNLKSDKSEKINLYGKPGYEYIEKDLMNRISDIILNGRSIPGKKLNNEYQEKWKQIYWLNEK